MCATYFHVTVGVFIVIMVLVHVDWGAPASICTKLYIK
jgi:hypothetical protein